MNIQRLAHVVSIMCICPSRSLLRFLCNLPPSRLSLSAGSAIAALRSLAKTRSTQCLTSQKACSFTPKTLSGQVNTSGNPPVPNLPPYYRSGTIISRLILSALFTLHEFFVTIILQSNLRSILNPANFTPRHSIHRAFT